MKARQVILWFLLMLIISGCARRADHPGGGRKELAACYLAFYLTMPRWRV